MTTKKITDLTELTAEPDVTDLLPIVDVSETVLVNKNKKITYANLVKVATAAVEANIKNIPALTELTVEPANDDVVAIYDINVSTYKKIRYDKLVKIATAAVTSTLTAAYQAADTTLSGTLTAAYIAADTVLNNRYKNITLYLKVVPETDALAVGDGFMYWTVPDNLNNYTIVKAAAAVYTASSSGLPTVQIQKANVDVLSTKITIDANETSSYTAATQPVIDNAQKTLTTGQVIRIDVDVAGTGTKGLDVILTVNPA